MIKRNLNVSNRVIRYRPHNSFCMFIICKQGLWHILFALAKHTGESSTQLNKLNKQLIASATFNLELNLRFILIFMIHQAETSPNAFCKHDFYQFSH